MLTSISSCLKLKLYCTGKPVTVMIGFHHICLNCFYTAGVENSWASVSRGNQNKHDWKSSRIAPVTSEEIHFSTLYWWMTFESWGQCRMFLKVSFTLNGSVSHFSSVWARMWLRISSTGMVTELLHANEHSSKRFQVYTVRSSIAADIIT